MSAQKFCAEDVRAIRTESGRPSSQWHLHCGGAVVVKGRSKRHQSSHSGTFSPRNKAAMFVLLFVFPFAFSFLHAPVLRRVEGSMWEGKEGVEKRLREGSSGEEIERAGMEEGKIESISFFCLSFSPSSERASARLS